MMDNQITHLAVPCTDAEAACLNMMISGIMLFFGLTSSLCSAVLHHHCRHFLVRIYAENQICMHVSFVLHCRCHTSAGKIVLICHVLLFAGWTAGTWFSEKVVHSFVYLRTHAHMCSSLHICQMHAIQP